MDDEKYSLSDSLDTNSRDKIYKWASEPANVEKHLVGFKNVISSKQVLLF